MQSSSSLGADSGLPSRDLSELKPSGVQRQILLLTNVPHSAFQLYYSDPLAAKRMADTFRPNCGPRLQSRRHSNQRAG